MSKSFSSLSAEEQNNLIKDLGELIVKHGIPSDVKTTREVVCNIRGSEIEDSYSVTVKASLPLNQAEKAAAFKEEAKKLVGDVEDVEIDVACVIDAGQKYKTIQKVTTIKDAGTEVSIEHKEGDVMLIDFWATWCPPCQDPMKHNQDMLEKHGDDWKQKNIRIIGLSIDQSAEEVVSHVEAKGWGSVEHYHRAKSDCSNVYSVRGVPHVMLVDQKGTIVFKGHPAGRPNLEEDLEKLAKGEELEGDNISKFRPACVDDEAAPEIKTPEGFEEADVSAYPAEILAFKDKCSGFQNNTDLKEAAKVMPRSFCVIVFQSSYNPVSQKTACKYENYRVLVGKQECIDKLKESFESLEGSWKVNLQERAM